jgi:membrane-bound serine protease (ClpP class)
LKLGDSGTTTTGLRPGGKARFAGGIFEVTSQGGFLEPGTLVEIVSVHGRQVVVKAASNLRGDA